MTKTYMYNPTLLGSVASAKDQSAATQPWIRVYYLCILPSIDHNIAGNKTLLFNIS